MNIYDPHFSEWHRLKCQYIEAELRNPYGDLLTEEECGMLAHRHLLAWINGDSQYDAHHEDRGR